MGYLGLVKLVGIGFAILNWGWICRCEEHSVGWLTKDLLSDTRIGESVEIPAADVGLKELRW